MRVLALEAERYGYLQEIIELRAFAEEAQEQEYFEASAERAIMDSFMENLYWVAGVLGLRELEILEDDVLIVDEFVIATGWGTALIRWT